MGLRGLFLLPPLDLPTHPYPAAAQLVTWMRLGGKEADGLDLNLAFFRWVVSSADRHAERAAAVLDGLPGEGGALGERLREAFACLEGLPSLDPWEAPPGSRLRAAWALLALAFAPWEGESPLWASHSIQYQGRADPHSSESILQALRTRSLFDLFYDDVLPSRGLDDYGYAGISVPFASQVEPALRLARSLKALRPGLRVFLGGPSASMQLAESRNASLLGFLDGIVVGPGERPMDAVARCLEEDGDLSKVPGLVHLVDGRIERVPLAKPVPLEEVPLPEPVFDRSAYLADGMVEPLRIRLSQGCTWARCAFCNITGHRHLFPLQRPDEEAVFRKVETLARRGEKAVYLADDEADPEMLERFSRWLLAREIRVFWTTNLRFTEKMTLEWARTLFAAGCRGPAVGLETLNDRLLALMRKGTDLGLIDRCLENLAWGSLPPMAFMMVGLPTETEEEARASFERLRGYVLEGKVDRAIYSLYGISPRSPVQRSPGRYGITAVRPPLGADLAPHCFDFDHAGMERRRAAELRAEFTRAIDETRRWRVESVARAAARPARARARGSVPPRAGRGPFPGFA